MGRNFSISFEEDMMSKGNYTPEQRLRFKKRAEAVKYVETEPFNDKISQKEFIDKHIRRGWIPTDEDNPYALISPDGTRKRTVSRQGMKDYLDVVLNRGEYEANYDLPEGANVVPERVKKPATEPAPTPDVPASAGEPDEFAGMDGAQVVQKLLKFVESGEYDKADKPLVHYINKRDEAKVLLDKFKEEADARGEKLNFDDPEVRKAFDSFVDWAGYVNSRIEDLRCSHANEEVKKALKVKTGVSIKRHISQNRYPFKKKQELDELNEGIDGFESIVSDEVNLQVKDVSFWRMPGKYRSSYNEGAGAPVIKCGANFTGANIVHELGHHLEWTGSGVRIAAQKFLSKRTQGEGYVPLKNYGHGYRGDELCKPDKFVDPYIGKYYGDGSTEVVSVGLAYYYSDPIGFLKKDPDHFAFIYDVVHGKFSEKKKGE